MEEMEENHVLKEYTVLISNYKVLVGDLLGKGWHYWMNRSLEQINFINRLYLKKQCLAQFCSIYAK